MKQDRIPTDQTRPAVLAAIEQYEREGAFDRHADPVDESIVIPVTPDFPYVPRTLTKRLRYFFSRRFIVYPFAKKVSEKMFCTVVKGKEHLQGIGAAILTCNHVDKFDCLVVQHACKPNRPFVVAAPFNNMRGSFGDHMRAGGMLPLGSDLATIRKFTAAVKHYLSRGKRILIYPEQAMWWHYEKPRPYKDGAFDLAARNGVPVVPCFITFRGTGVFDGNGIEQKHFTLHIMPPLYPKKELSFRENVAFLRDENMRMCKRKYKEVYGKDPEYTTEQSNATATL
ncbi:MAG: 1-acyl-sn-glycerol-3-phosphate acyltransferase [Clostridia bacterium]|nr:1-acyl-sn-glycerol-3-phosphate acyltransferase [Clostridia bacterium]